MAWSDAARAAALEARRMHAAKGGKMGYRDARNIHELNAIARGKKARLRANSRALGIMPSAYSGRSAYRFGPRG